MIYRRDGTKMELDHKTTVEICQESMETGKEFHEIVRKRIEPQVKVIRFTYDEE